MKKLIVGLVFAGLLLAPVSVVKAQTVDETVLRAQIDALMAQIVVLIGQLQAQLTAQIEAQSAQIAAQSEVIAGQGAAQEERLERIERNTEVKAVAIPSVRVIASSNQQMGQAITTNPTAQYLDINFEVGNPDNNNINPGFDCEKSGDWSGSMTPVDHSEDATSYIRGITETTTLTFGVTCSNAGGSKSGEARVVVEPVLENE